MDDAGSGLVIITHVQRETEWAEGVVAWRTIYAIVSTVAYAQQPHSRTYCLGRQKMWLCVPPHLKATNETARNYICSGVLHSMQLRGKDSFRLPFIPTSPQSFVNKK